MSAAIPRACRPVRRAARRPSAPSFRRAALAAFCFLVTAPPAVAQEGPALARQVEVLRTTYGIPHIRAENLRAAGYGLGWVQLEDHGYRVVHGLIRARGELARHFGADSIAADFRNRQIHRRAIQTYHLLEEDTREVYEGFAAGVNRYIELHPDEFPDWVRPDFTGHDIAAQGIVAPSAASVRRVLERIRADAPGPIALAGNPEDGSNAWALAPSRTKSGKAILLRNPHLSWTAGYYEAHVTVPGKLDFYGDFRIGGPLGIIGGFNRRLGWATTNNAPDLDEIYALELDPTRPDHYLFDGASVPLRREVVTVEVASRGGPYTASREVWSTPLGPVVHRDEKWVYVHRAAGQDEFRTGEQFLKMMMARDLEEWKAAVRMRARTSSNLTYADADGNIFYVWNATIPALPHAPGGDTTAVPAARSREVWIRPVAFDSLPQLLNPKGGYVRNENDPPYFTNLHRPLERAKYPENFPEVRLRLRSQHSLELLHNKRKFSLEDVVREKHSMRMLLADRVKADLVAAVRASDPAPEVAAAIELIERWDNTVAAESRGAVLFERWWSHYLATAEKAPATPASSGFPAEATSLFRKPWTPEEPMSTPHGLADPKRAAEAFARAVEETTSRYGSWDVAWGAVHRVRWGRVDVPVGGCSGMLGCFRVLSFKEAEDGKRVVDGGDGWVLAVEFGKTPRAYSVLAYGQSSKPDSPHYDDQAELFARNEMKPVAFTEKEIEAQLVRRYRPGLVPGDGGR